MMSVTDGLQHHGSIETQNDMNYLHGYGLKSVNRLYQGFIGGGKYFKSVNNYQNPTDASVLTTSRENILVNPKFGFIFVSEQNRTLIYNKDLSLIATIPTTNYSGTSKYGMAYNGDTLIASANKLIVVGYNANILRQVDISLNIGSGVSIVSVNVDSKRDRFVITVSRGTFHDCYVGQFSTLEIKNTFRNNLISGFRSTFLSDGKLLQTSSTASFTWMTIFEFNNSYVPTQVNAITSSTHYFVTLDYDGKAVCTGFNGASVYSVDLNTGSSQLIATITGNLTDCDRTYFYTVTSNAFQVINRSSQTIVATLPINSSYIYESSPIHMRGKLPECKSFY